MVEWFLKFLLDESGQVEAQDSDASDGSTDTDTEGAEEEAAAAEGQEETGEEEGEENFVDPATLTDDIRNSPEFKGMQRAYSRKMHLLRENSQKLQMLDRMNNDPEYLRQFVTAAAQKVGLQIANGQAQQTQSDDDLASVVQAALPPEYAEAIPGLSQAIAKAVEAATVPIKKQTEMGQQESLKRLQQQEWDKAAMELTEVDPEWEEDSDEIGDLWQFLKGPDMFHPIWGNKLVALRKLAKGDDFATTQAVNRIRKAGRNKTQVGQHSGRVSLVDIHKQIQSAERAQDKWEIAGKHAIEQVNKNGSKAI